MPVAVERPPGPAPIIRISTGEERDVVGAFDIVLDRIGL
jgi:hypothetical protein